MFRDFIKVWSILAKLEKRKIKFASLVLFFNGILDIIGIISILPIIYILADREEFLQNPFVIKFNSFLNLDIQSLIILISILSIFIIIFTNTFKIFSQKFAERTSMSIWHNIHNRLYEYYLNKEYSFHLKNSSNSLLEKLQIRVNSVVAGIITPIFYLLSSLSSICFICIVLFFNNFMVSISIFFILFMFYFFIFSNLKVKLEKFGQMGPIFSKKAFKLINDSFISIKEIKITHNEKFYLDLFNPIAKKYCEAMINKKIYSIIPSILIEILVICILYIFILFLIYNNFDLISLAPQIALFFFSFRRLVPAFQEVYLHLSHVRFYKPSFEVIYDDLYNAFNYKKSNIRNQNVQFNEKILLKNINFNYENNNSFSIKNVNLKINKGEKIAILGRSGSGKSTLLDILLGILKQKEGEIVVDGIILDNNGLLNWQKKIGYVPQIGFLSDSSIIENIAFSVDKEKANFKKIKSVSQIAEISDFIENELPNHYQTIVGERGIKMSGGQRQRICIARALYFENDIIVFDEATSALDTITENKIFSNMKEIYSNKTIIIVTHRISSVKNADRIFFMENGSIIDSGTFNDLLNRNNIFENLLHEQNK
tara:strand:- start:394 stop:2187 length:1794 start_codon:yes stop_codon:yes gene_type:complete